MRSKASSTDTGAGNDDAAAGAAVRRRGATVGLAAVLA
jgi:hypothetical protein